MKIVGLITEYNPFHNGHLYHMQQAKTITGADYCVVLMSGSFVQRGEPAIFDKYTRTKAALLAGADLVLEMPVAFSTSSAHEFAAYAVALLSALGADDVVFGSECADIEKLKQIAFLLNHESGEFKLQLKSGLKEGLTYPQARAAALEKNLSGTYEEWNSILNSPNNILGIEYLRAAHLLNSSIKFHTILRNGSGYNDDTLSEEQFPSALAIRESIYNCKSNRSQMHDILSDFVPHVTIPAYKESVPVFPDDFSELLSAAVLKMQHDCRQSKVSAKSGADILINKDEHDACHIASSIADLSSEMACRIIKQPFCPVSFSERVQTLKTRQLTYTRVSRALIHLVLGIQNEDVSALKENGYAPYARILGFQKQSSPLLSCIHKRSSIPLITKLADADKVLPASSLSMLNQEIYASHLYQTVRIKHGGRFQNEYTEGLIIL